jgi:probable HAF family extracellular repeat protein
MIRRSVTALVSVGLLLIGSLSIAQPKITYTLTQIGTNNAATTTFVSGINDEGMLGMTVTTATATNVYLWRHGTTTNIGGLEPAATFVEGGALNDLVQVIGSGINPATSDFSAFIWQSGHATALPSPANSPSVFASQINLLGEVTGQAYDESFISHAVMWNHGQLTILASPPGSQFTQPVGLNLLGEIAGVSYDENDTPSTLIWRKGVLTVAVPGAMPNGLNDLGQIVGFANDAPFIWEASTVTVLPLIGKNAEGAAQAINDLGQIVGSETTASGVTEALLWQGSGASVVNLNTLISPSEPSRKYVTLASGMFINNLGQIVATGNDSRIPDFQQYYLLTPNL